MADKLIPLPEPQRQGKVSLEETIARRRSVRAFGDQPLTLEQIGQLLWSAQGVTNVTSGKKYRAAPSAGAIYPLEIFILTGEGVFQYNPEEHQLSEITNQDLRSTLAKAAFFQDFVATAPLDIVICGQFEKITRHYGKRGKQYTHNEVGHIAQNIHLQAVSIGLGSVPVGAFDETAVSAVLSLKAGLTPLYIIPVGYAR